MGEQRADLVGSAAVALQGGLEGGRGRGGAGVEHAEEERGGRQLTRHLGDGAPVGGGLDVRAGGDQEVRDVDEDGALGLARRPPPEGAVLGGAQQRRVAVGALAEVDVGARGEDSTDGVEVAAVHGVDQRGEAVLVLGVEVRAGADAGVDRVEVTREGGVVKRGRGHRVVLLGSARSAPECGPPMTPSAA